MRDVIRRARWSAFLVTVLVSGALIVAASGSAAAQTVTRTFPAVHCTATVNGSTISQNQDVTVSITAPDSVTPGEVYTVTFPGSTTVLPNKSNGLTITSYSNIFLSYQIHGATFVSGSIVNPGTATINGNSTPENASLSAPDTIVMGEPGPFPPGTLVTPDISVSVTAGADGSSATVNALTLTTDVVLNGSIHANATCDIPQDTLITIPVGAASTPPTVNAGPDVSGVINSQIALDGSVTDPDSTPTDSWTSSDPACTFADPTAPSTTVSCTKPGTFTVTLTADDGVNAPVSDSAQVVVTQNVPLSVSAGGAVSGAISHQIPLNGSVSDPGRTPTVQWTANSSACSFGDPSSAVTTISCNAIGTYVATITANDGVNPPASDTATVTVHADVPPTVDAGGDTAGNTATPISLNGVVTDPDDTPTVQWTANSSACSFADPTQAATTITCSIQGNYTATLTADDGFNPAVSDTVAVTVTDVLFPFNWDVNATTHLKKLNQDVTVPPGTFTGVVDLTTGQLNGDITLPPAPVTLSLAGIGLVTANMQITEAQPITGTLDVSTFEVTATAVFNIKVLSVYPVATPTVNLVGDSCQTSKPVSVTMSGAANLSGSSTFSGVYTIPKLKTCELTTAALNLVIPGPGNTFSATVAPPTDPTTTTTTTEPTTTTTTVPANVGPKVNIGSATVSEGDAGQKSVPLAVTLDQVSAQTVTVAYATQAGTATAGSDFKAKSGSLVFKPGQVSKLIPVSVLGDTVPELDETFSVDLMSATNATIGNGEGDVTIIDDDAPTASGITAAVSDDAVYVTPAGKNTQLSFVVSLNRTPSATVSLQYQTQAGTAGASDFKAKSGTLTFSTKQLSKVVTIVVPGNSAAALDKDMSLVISTTDPSVTIVDPIGLGTIHNDH